MAVDKALLVWQNQLYTNHGKFPHKRGDSIKNTLAYFLYQPQHTPTKEALNKPCDILMS